LPEWTINDDAENAGFDSTDLQIVWRGGLRRGRLIWNLETDADRAELPPADPNFYVGKSSSPNSPEKAAQTSGVPRVFWQPAPLTPYETDTILRYSVLLYDASLREEYGEQIRAAGHSALIAVEKIWNRIFLEDASFAYRRRCYDFTEESATAETLTAVFGDMLAPLFEARYPQHPAFGEPLGMNEVSQLVNDFLQRRSSELPESQFLAEIFALPLGLVAASGNFVRYRIRGKSQQFAARAESSASGQ
jgi:hypothetical protein